ncbi:MAG: 16S rRNA (guanine(527)-N(7))-methyltransferase RsmG [Deltaproteobacteria bacterium HGW-Deltaproteobacteria-23]|jgi:16S rRNA (guanine527-N7)-methyltransferase|nr:MAG: 16S rRNA (guanine(527)-N(7))-methyltransferase RsmG [Deltaproteobacteria bacterium HGW-Deltaproteobacteria-23]
MKTLQDTLKKGASELEIELSAMQLESFTLYAKELCKWNGKINLTSIIQPEEIAIKHFLDSLTLAKYTSVAGKLLDIGSGGGFPGIPLKIIAPETFIVSVDAVAKKINFQRHIIRALGLTGFTALHCRAENLVPEYKGNFNLVVSRAFADIAVFVKHALPLLANEGVIIAMKGKGGRVEAGTATAELKMMGAAVTAVHEFELPILKDLRALVIIRRMQ